MLIQRFDLNRNIVAVSIFLNTAILPKKFLRFDPTLGSNNSGLKNSRIKNHHIFGIARTSAFIWHIWIPLKKFCKRTRRVCVCIVLVHFGRYSQEVNEKSVKLAVWAVSLNFLHDFTLFVVDIHQIRLISLFRHFSDHFHFHPILEQKRVIDLIPCHIWIKSWVGFGDHKCIAEELGGAFLSISPQPKSSNLGKQYFFSFFQQYFSSFFRLQQIWHKKEREIHVFPNLRQLKERSGSEI